MAGKKIKKQFEPRLAHTAVIIDQFVIVFGGLNSQKNSLISNDIYVLCLNDETQKIIPPPAFDKKNGLHRRKGVKNNESGFKSPTLPSAKERA